MHRRRIPLERFSADALIALVRLATAWWIFWLCSAVFLILMIAEPTGSSWKFVYGFGCLVFSACSLASLWLRDIAGRRDRW